MSKEKEGGFIPLDTIVSCNHKLLQEQLRLRKEELLIELNENDYSEIESVIISKHNQIDCIERLLIQLKYS